MNENTNKNACPICGHEADELVTVTIDGTEQAVCAECAEDNGYVRCDDCGEWIPADESYTTATGRTICESCYDYDYGTCEDRGEIYPTDDLTLVNPNTRSERYVCDDCLSDYYQCDDCGDYFDSDHIYSDDCGTCVCHDCYNDRWHTCENCDRLIRDDDTFWVNGDPYCESCYDELDDRGDGRNFHDYGYKPTPLFNSRKGENAAAALMFGIEDEVDRGNGNGRSELCDALTELDQPIYMKYDGSLGSAGVEIVTHPGTLAYHMYELRWASICRTCLDHDYKSHDTTTCGLHIHVGRNAMGNNAAERHAVAGRLVLLADRLKDALTVFSRRKPEQLSQWAPFPYMELAPSDSDVTLENIALGTSIEGWHGDRYRAVNLTNTSTVEFRIFRGTLKRDTIIASIQLVNNMVKYAMSHTAHECTFDATFGDILAVESFKELNTYAATRGLL